MIFKSLKKLKPKFETCLYKSKLEETKEFKSRKNQARPVLNAEDFIQKTNQVQRKTKGTHNPKLSKLMKNLIQHYIMKHI